MGPSSPSGEPGPVGARSPSMPLLFLSDCCRQLNLTARVLLCRRSSLISPAEEKADSAWGRGDGEGAVLRLKALRASVGLCAGPSSAHSAQGRCSAARWATPSHASATAAVATSRWAVILARGGHFAAAVVSGGGSQILAHRTFHRRGCVPRAIAPPIGISATVRMAISRPALLHYKRLLRGGWGVPAQVCRSRQAGRAAERQGRNGQVHQIRRVSSPPRQRAGARRGRALHSISGMHARMHARCHSNLARVSNRPCQCSCVIARVLCEFSPHLIPACRL